MNRDSEIGPWRKHGDRARQGVNAVAAGTARDAPAPGDRDGPSVAGDRAGDRLERREASRPGDARRAERRERKDRGAVGQKLGEHLGEAGPDEGAFNSGQVVGEPLMDQPEKDDLGPGDYETEEPLRDTDP